MIHCAHDASSGVSPDAMDALMPEQASLFRSDVPLASPLEGHLLWDLALITPGLARINLLYCNVVGQSAACQDTGSWDFVVWVHPL